MKHQRPFRLLLKLFQDRFFESDDVSPGGGFQTNISQVLGFLLTSGFVVSYIMMPAVGHIMNNNRGAQLGWALRGFQLFSPTYTFAVIGFAAFFEWDMLFPSRRDFLILAPFPIRLRDLFAAQFTALAKFLGLLIFAGIGINFANVVGRYLFQSPILWAEEILVFIMIWCVFLGVILVTWEGRHIKMDLLSVKFAPPWREIINGLMTLGFVLVCAFVIRESWGVVKLLYQTGQETVIARLPVAPMHASILIGFSAMLIVVLLRLRHYLSGDFGSDAEATTRQLMETYGDIEPEADAGERKAR